MVSTVLKYSKVTDVAKYLSSSRKLKKATLMEIKKEAQEYEKSNENFIRSLSSLYAGGVIGKVKYMQGLHLSWGTQGRLLKQLLHQLS